MRSRLLACVGAICIIIALILAIGWVRGLSRDQPRITPEPSSEVVSPSLTPSPSDEARVPPPSTGKQVQKHWRHITQRCVPTRVLVPKINVDTRVLLVGTDATGAQIVPSDPTEVSWLKKGAMPGHPGNAVFAGHTWSQGDGVFDQLSKLAKNDIVKVQATHCDLTFQVDSVKRHVPVNLSQQKVAELYRLYGRPGIVMITCGDFTQGVYHSRIVVHANLK